MIKKIRNYVNLVRKNKIIIFLIKNRKIMDVIIIVIGLCFLINGYFSVSRLARAIILMVILVIYKWVGHEVGIYKGYLNYELTSEFLERNNEKRREVDEKLVKVINNKLCKKYPVVLEIIFWGLRMIPWNWWNSLLLKIFEIWYDIVIIISSNKDIYYKKRGKNKTMEEWSLCGKKYSYVYEWVIKYPILRLLLVPEKIRVKIFWYKSEWDLLRVRFIIYFYGIIYIYEEYYEYVYEVSWIYKGIIIYVLVGVMWPLWIYLHDMLEQKREYKYYEPTIDVFFFDESSITKRLLKRYVDVLWYERRGLYNVKYNYLYGMKLLTYEKIEPYSGDLFSIYGWPEDKWKYEKTYGVSFIAYESLVTHLWKIKVKEYYMNIYILGERELGRRYMEKKYSGSIEKLKAYYRCYDYLLMDVRRLLGLEKWAWAFTLGNYSGLEKVQTSETFVYSYLKREIELNVYKMVPERYMFSMKLYNRLLIYSNYVIFYFPLTLTEFMWGCIRVDEGMNSILADIASERTGSKLSDKKFEELTEVEREVFKKEIIDYAAEFARVSKLTFHILQIIEGWTKEFDEEYKKEFEKMGDKRRLVSEKYIVEYIDRYIIKK